MMQQSIRVISPISKLCFTHYEWNRLKMLVQLYNLCATLHQLFKCSFCHASCFYNQHTGWKMLVQNFRIRLAFLFYCSVISINWTLTFRAILNSVKSCITPAILSGITSQLDLKMTWNFAIRDHRQFQSIPVNGATATVRYCCSSIVLYEVAYWRD